jgi:4-amino-4-deoxy-L-arabinose transferase-like glycosyltransferase
MRLRSHRRSMVVWSQSASSVGRSGSPSFTRVRRIRRWIRTGALFAVVGLMSLARAGRARWRLLLAGGVLTVVGVMLHAFVGVVLLFLVSAPFAAARPRTGRIRRSELEPDLGVYSHPAQLRLAIRAMDLHDHRFPVTGRD